MLWPLTLPRKVLRFKKMHMNFVLCYGSICIRMNFVHTSSCMQIWFEYIISSMRLNSIDSTRVKMDFNNDLSKACRSHVSSTSLVYWSWIVFHFLLFSLLRNSICSCIYMPICMYVCQFSTIRSTQSCNNTNYINLVVFLLCGTLTLCCESKVYSIN